jgi:phenylalanyl-tRNA synthetase beta chain
MVNQSLTRSVFHIEEDVIAFTLDIETITFAEKEMMSFMPYSQYPAVHMDISVLLEKATQAGDVISRIKEVGGDLLRNVTIQDVYEKENTPRSILFSIHYQSKEKNLTTEEVNELHKKIGEDLQTTFGVTVRRKELEV